MKFVSYIRVSTARQGQSGLGLDAQRDTVAQFVASRSGTLLAEHVEIETGKGANALERRPQLQEALRRCQREGATLVIAKLDRLSRSVHFVSGLMESKVRFIACDLPEANELTIHIMAAFAEHEAKRISQRTKDALAVAKARGVKLGVRGAENLRRNVEGRRAESTAFGARLKGTLDGMRLRGLSQRAMVTELNSLGIRAPRGGPWRLSQLQRVMSKATETEVRSGAGSKGQPCF